jgi:hypothetical protein
MPTQERSTPPHPFDQNLAPGRAHGGLRAAADNGDGDGLLVIKIDDLFLDLREPLRVDTVLEGRRPRSPQRGRARGLAARRSKQQRRRTEAVVCPFFLPVFLLILKYFSSSFLEVIHS